MPTDELRARLRAQLRGPDYMTFDQAVADFPMAHINRRPPRVPYTPWHLLEHIRRAQRDILDYVREAEYRELSWPDDYWPPRGATADAKAWKETLAGFRRDLAALEKIAANPRIRLSGRLPHGRPHTYLRELMIAGEHTTYHVAEFAILRQTMGTWPRRRP